jgi:ABC-2 type transport system ATP-binding protein
MAGAVRLTAMETDDSDPYRRINRPCGDPPGRALSAEANRNADTEPMNAIAASSPATGPVPAAQPEWAVEMKGLTKIYAATGRSAAKHALKGIDLNIRRGSFFGLLGPNGAGKSTMINILAGLVMKTAGQASIWGYDIDSRPRQSRAAIGVVPQELILDPFFTPRELLDLQAGLYGVPRAERRTDELLEAVGLADKANAYARALSGGMRRRLMVAKALVHTPPVLVLDEPTAGVDIELRQSLWAYVRELNRNGTTVLLTTHYLEEAQELCDTIAIINNGMVAACEPTPKLLGRMDRKELWVTVDRDLTVIPARLSHYQTELPEPRRLVVRYQPSRDNINEVLAAVQQSGLVITDLSTKETDLEDIFLQLVQAQRA